MNKLPGKVMQLHNHGNAADFLGALARDFRARRVPPQLIVVLGVHREGDAQHVEFHAGPTTPTPLEFLGLIEMGKASFISGDGAR